MNNSYLNYIKDRFIKFFDEYIINDNSTSYHDKFIKEQSFLSNLLKEISIGLDQEYTKDKQNAYSYISDQIDLSKSLYLL